MQSLLINLVIKYLLQFKKNNFILYDKTEKFVEAIT